MYEETGIVNAGKWDSDCFPNISVKPKIGNHWIFFMGIFWIQRQIKMKTVGLNVYSDKDSL